MNSNSGFYSPNGKNIASQVPIQFTEDQLLQDFLNYNDSMSQPQIQPTQSGSEFSSARLELNTEYEAGTNNNSTDKVRANSSSSRRNSAAQKLTDLVTNLPSTVISGFTNRSNNRATSAGDEEMTDFSNNPARKSSDSASNQPSHYQCFGFGPDSADPNHKNDSWTHVEPLTDLPAGMGQYEDFETIGWLKEVARDRARHRKIHDAKWNSCWKFVCAFCDSGSGWFCVLLIGVITGVFAGHIDIGTSWLSDMKEGLCVDAFWLNKEECCWTANDTIGFDDPDCAEWYTWSKLFIGKDPTGEHPDAYFVSYVAYIASALGLSYLCVMLVRVFAPYACGSGIPEIKTILSGFVIRGYLGKWTLLIKSVGMMLVVSAGLALGKEGPMVHMAACVGNILAYLFPKYGNNEAKKREILSASAAAGVAVAFGAPLGGVLFSLEEASYYFPLKTMFRSFFCAMVAANVLRIMNPFGTEHLVMFYVEYTSNWHNFELVAFAMLGILGGVFGALFIKFNLLICRLRKNTWYGNHPIREVLIVTFITALFSFPHPFLRYSSSQLVRNLVTQCGPGDNLEWCDYKQNFSDPSLQSFGSFPAGPGVYSSLWLLAIAMIFKMIVFVFTFGMKVPAGLFIPSMTVGAIMGRMLGIGVEQFVVAHRSSWFLRSLCKSSQACINPGLYAMVGAAACLGGVTRMTISLVVIMLELTGGLTYIIPLMVASMFSKWTGDRLTSGGIYEAHIKLNGYPYLSTEDYIHKTTLASDVMKPRPTDPPLQTITQDSMTISEVETVLSSTKYNGFPIVVSHESRYLVGFVTRRELTWALDHGRLSEGIGPNSAVYFTESNSSVAGVDQEDVVAMISNSDMMPQHSDTGRLYLRHILDLCPITVTDRTPMETVMDFFRKLGIRQVLVTRNGRLLGIITKKDVLRHILQLQNQDPDSVAFS